MIDYALLCQTLAAWRSGQRPGSGPSPAARSGIPVDDATPEPVDDVDADEVVLEDDDGMSSAAHAEAGY